MYVRLNENSLLTKKNLQSYCFTFVLKLMRLILLIKLSLTHSLSHSRRRSLHFHIRIYRHQSKRVTHTHMYKCACVCVCLHSSWKATAVISSQQRRQSKRDENSRSLTMDATRPTQAMYNLQQASTCTHSHTHEHPTLWYINLSHRRKKEREIFSLSFFFCFLKCN